MSRIIDDMTTEEIQQHLKIRRGPIKKVAFYVSKDIYTQYKRLRAELASKIVVPESKKQPTKYNFNPESMVTKKLCLEFENGEPLQVSYNNCILGCFTMQRQSDDDFMFTIESKDCVRFWTLLEQAPNLYVEVETCDTNVGISNTVQVFANVMIADFSWFY